ncbi:MAG: phenylalanine--tRNA ligase subunit beta [Acetobacteraceae bacterium]|nr:phenylalanine--tRNA ligase subunit beta [Acetobacteraceae bacterium]
MKFTLSWLGTHLDTDADAAAIAARLSAIGLEVEEVVDRGAALAPFRIARVIEAVQHPNADRLRACIVDPGDGARVSVVCGAPNARTGMKGVFAAPGSFIPGTGVTLKAGEIRGVLSAGMLLSAREMGLGEDHDGIVELPEDAPVGEAYARWAGLDDPVIHIKVTPNRGDALSVRGIARDLAAAGIGTLKPWSAAPVPAAFASPITWAIASPGYCPYVLGRSLRGLANGPSPQWLRERLSAIGLRPINRLVDVTNFFTFDLGRPLHVFDASKVHGSVLTMAPGDGRPFLALNGKEVAAGHDDCVIADAAGPESLAGIIGGERSGCDEATTDAFIECAYFDPVRVALSGRRHGIQTDARYRFERGIDAALMPQALEAATRMMLEICGGEASEVVAAGHPPAWQRTAGMRFTRLAGLGGLAVPADEVSGILDRLGFIATARDAERITVAVPSWRNDIAAPTALEQAGTLAPELAARAAAGRDAIEPEADLVEEVLRIRGLDSVPPVSMPAVAPVPAATLSPQQQRTALARRTLAARGLAEAVTFSFIEKRVAALFGSAPAGLAVENPIAADLDQLRPTPVANLLLAAARNAARGAGAALLCEIGPGFNAADEAGQRLIAAALRCGQGVRAWAGSREPDPFDAKADALAVLVAIGVNPDGLMATAEAPAWYHPGRSGVLKAGRTVLASFGALHPRVLAALDLAWPAVAMEVFLDAVPEPKRRKRGAPDLPAFQPVRRDFAFLVEASVPADAVLRAARGAERTLVAGAVLFDAYAGDKVAPGTKSLGVEVTFQPRERTLTDAEIEAASAKVVAAVAKATGATLRA